jgi:hypothetical protein
MRRAAIPSPTAEPSCLVDPERTSPAANTPGRDVSMVELVAMKPLASRSTASPRKAPLGFMPINTKAAAVPPPAGGHTAPVALELENVYPGVDRELRVGPHALLQQRRGGQAGAGQHPYPLGEFGQVQPLLEGRVAAADHDDLLGSFVERPVARRAEVNADEVFLTGHAEAPVRRPGGHDHGVGGELLPG